MENVSIIAGIYRQCSNIRISNESTPHPPRPSKMAARAPAGPGAGGVSVGALGRGRGSWKSTTGVPLHRGGDAYSLDNLMVLTRGEHVAKTRKENERPDPARAKWRRLVAELL